MRSKNDRIVENCAVFNWAKSTIAFYVVYFIPKLLLPNFTIYMVTCIINYCIQFSQVFETFVLLHVSTHVISAYRFSIIYLCFITSFIFNLILLVLHGGVGTNTTSGNHKIGTHTWLEKGIGGVPVPFRIVCMFNAPYIFSWTWKRLHLSSGFDSMVVLQSYCLFELQKNEKNNTTTVYASSQIPLYFISFFIQWNDFHTTTELKHIYIQNVLCQKLWTNLKLVLKTPRLTYRTVWHL